MSNAAEPARINVQSIRRILVATDGSTCADAAAALAVRLAQPVGAKIDLVTVVDTSGWTETSGDPSFRRRRAAEVCEQARKCAQQFRARHFGDLEGVSVHVRDGEDTAAEIVRAAAALHSELIVMGTRGTSGLAHLILGSVAEKVVRTSAVPVVTVRAPV